MQDNIKNLLDYEKLYKFYKALPVIYFVFTLAVTLIWGIVDWTSGITSIGYDLPLLPCILVWELMGAVVGVIIMFFSALCISATVVRTDAILEMRNKS